MGIYKFIDPNGTVLAVKEEDQFQYVSYNAEDDIVVFCKNKDVAFGVKIGSQIYSFGVPIKNYPIGQLKYVDLVEYKYLQSLIKDEDVKSTAYDDYLESISDNSNLKTSKEYVIKEMRFSCNKKMIEGIKISLSDNVGYCFELTLEDQLNLQNIKYLISQGETQFAYHSKGEPFRYYSKEEMQLIIDAANKHILYHNSYFNSLRNYINSLESIQEVNSIYYGQDFPNKYKSEVLLSLEQEISKNY